MPIPKVKCCKDCILLSHLTNNKSYQTFTHQYLNNDLSMDFTSILRIPTKIMIPQMTRFFPCNKNNNYLTWLKLFFREIIRLHTFPTTILSNGDVKFVSYFWQLLWKLLDAQLKYSYVFHPQINGQTKVFLLNLPTTIQR